MKKTFIMALACSFFAVNAVNAQNEEKYYGAEQGGFAFSVNAEPVINFAGNILNGTSDNALEVEDLAKAIAGKFYLTDNIALTAGLSVNNEKNISFEYRDPDGDLEKVTEESSNKTRDWMFGIGAQYTLRPGKRLQPFVGAGIAFGKKNTINFSESFLDDETISKTSNPTTCFGLVANVGVEYFLGKNISISALLDLGLYQENSKVKSEYETDKSEWEDQHPYGDFDDFVDSQNYTRKDGKTTFFKTGLMNGNISLNFYF